MSDSEETISFFERRRDLIFIIGGILVVIIVTIVVVILFQLFSNRELGIVKPENYTLVEQQTFSIAYPSDWNISNKENFIEISPKNSRVDLKQLTSVTVTRGSSKALSNNDRTVLQDVVNLNCDSSAVDFVKNSLKLPDVTFTNKAAVKIHEQETCKLEFYKDNTTSNIKTVGEVYIISDKSREDMYVIFVGSNEEDKTNFNTAKNIPLTFTIKALPTVQ